MRRLTPILVISTAAVLAAGPSFDLLEIGHISPKGRVQDQSSNSVVASILGSGKDSIPVLIDLIESERIYEQSPLDYWPQVREGDVALVILDDLFRDPTWEESTLPDLCWDRLLERTDANLPAWDLLNRYVQRNGRATLADKWRTAWAEHQESIVWDPEGLFFRVSGRELAPC